MTFPTAQIGHSRHDLFFTRWIVNPMLILLKRTMNYPGFAEAKPLLSTEYEKRFANKMASKI
jgi:hypothetical protein